MTVKKICSYEKYGYCKSKNECKDHHPTEICSEPICNISKCVKRHPQVCRYFKTGNCRFKDACKYDHKKQINNKELLDRNINLENEIKEAKEKYSKLEAEQKKTIDMNKLLHDRLTNIEHEYVNFLKKYSEESDTENTDMNIIDVTSVNDDRNKDKHKYEEKENMETDDVTFVSDDQRETKRKRNNEDLKIKKKKTKLENNTNAGVLRSTAE